MSIGVADSAEFQEELGRGNKWQLLQPGQPAKATLRVVLVGERGRAGIDRAFVHNVDSLLKLGAFQDGHGRRKLLGAGLRWTDAMNLLTQNSAWSAGRAFETAEAVRGELERRYDLIVLCGRRVATAFRFSRFCSLPSLHDKYLLVPHPSGYSNGEWIVGLAELHIRKLFRLAEARIYLSRRERQTSPGSGTPVSSTK